ncbi:MAG: DUF5107 domain-containing protein [Marinifilaceae bacterium]
MVKAWSEQVIIPTYETGVPEKNPIFLENRVYQGSSGVVYPYPVIESIADEKTDKSYNAVFLENEYIKIMILPELGGRVQMAYDKIKERHFIYYNQVVKPALVGLTGPWISGGIEFNWPQHHRPSTFMPVDWCIEEFEDGSITVWMSEMEKMFHQKGMAGFTLYPGKAYLEIKGKLYNRTSVPQTFLWWANPAVAVNEHYQSVFPPDVNAVFDHGKRDVSSFPIATGTYYKVDYSAGVDISNYKNIPVPTSYMAIQSKYNFVGGYENDTRAGVLHVANHHISPGKKQWTWGNGDFGKAWDRNLTDEDGPYIELMAGVYTDNQPDFSWLQPYEEKSFVQYFLPYRELGMVKNASKDLLISVDKTDESVATIKLFATSRQEVVLVVRENGKPIMHEQLHISPKEIYEQSLCLTEELSRYEFVVFSMLGKELLTWKPEDDVEKLLPEAAKAASTPEDTQTIEELYLTGLHLEQYRHATYCATDYYLEALKREPLDARCNNAMGLWYYRKGRFDLAEPYLRTAIATLTSHNPNPYDGEPYYNLGLVLRMRNKLDEAYGAFYKACWNAAWQDAGYMECARISSLQLRYQDALHEVQQSLIRNWHNHKARHLKSILLRYELRLQEALKWIDDSVVIDRFNFGCLYERYLLTQDSKELDAFTILMRGCAENYETIALDYAFAGFYEEAIGILRLAEQEGCTTPMTFYYMAWCMMQSNQQADEVWHKAVMHTPDGCFPNRLEAIVVLEAMQKQYPQDARAPYYLGNLWYDKRQYDLAIASWELARERDVCFPTTWRNLALAYFNKKGAVEDGIACLEKAFFLEPTDGRVLMELDQLYKRVGSPHDFRLALLESYPELVTSRDDLYLEYITLLNQIGNYEKAMYLLDQRRFHPWEGGEGKVPTQYQFSRVELAKKAIGQKKYKEAIGLLEECLEYPHHLGEGKLAGAQDNDFYYFLGVSYQGIGDDERAKYYWKLATQGDLQPAAAIFYNDQKPDKLFYKGMALRELGEERSSQECFRCLMNYGAEHLNDRFTMDYFAVSLPDLLIWDSDLTLANQVHCNYMIALGAYGVKDYAKAELALSEAAARDNNHQGIMSLQSYINI